MARERANLPEARPVEERALDIKAWDVSIDSSGLVATTLQTNGERTSRSKLVFWCAAPGKPQCIIVVPPGSLPPRRDHRFPVRYRVRGRDDSQWIFWSSRNDSTLVSSDWRARGLAYEAVRGASIEFEISISESDHELPHSPSMASPRSMWTPGVPGFM